MIRAAALALLALLAPSTSPAARDVGSMYDERVLSPWRERYQAKLDDVYGGPVWRALTPAERRRLEGVRIEVPLMATGEARGDPFVFYAEPGPPGRVVMPALSIYFFEELLGAFAWLAQRGDDPAVVGDYLAMLKYQGRERFEGDRYPTPFEALGVPEAAWRDRYVLEFARGGLKTAVLYILAHELGHHVRGHLDRAPDSAANCRPASTTAGERS